jgi:hypothetical protein
VQVQKQVQQVQRMQQHVQQFADDVLADLPEVHEVLADLPEIHDVLADLPEVLLPQQRKQQHHVH